MFKFSENTRMCGFVDIGKKESMNYKRDVIEHLWYLFDISVRNHLNHVEFPYTIESFKYT